jgi:hypothetical protein
MTVLNITFVVLGGLSVTVIANTPSFGCSNSAEGEEILSTLSFGEDVKPSAPFRKVLRRVKNPSKSEKGYFLWQNSSFPWPVPPLLLLDNSANRFDR